MRNPNSVGSSAQTARHRGREKSRPREAYTSRHHKTPLAIETSAIDRSSGNPQQEINRSAFWHRSNSKASHPTINATKSGLASKIRSTSLLNRSAGHILSFLVSAWITRICFAPTRFFTARAISRPRSVSVRGPTKSSNLRFRSILFTMSNVRSAECFAKFNRTWWVNPSKNPTDALGLSLWIN